MPLMPEDLDTIRKEIAQSLFPHLPTSGPPVPRFLPGWPATIEDIEKAVYHYRESMFGAMEHYHRMIPIAIEKYRQALMRRLP